MNRTTNNLDIPRKEDLSVEELRNYKGLENITYEQALHIIESLKELSILLYYAVNKRNKIDTKYVDNQLNMYNFVETKAA